jgi:hypothetical protein
VPDHHRTDYPNLSVPGRRRRLRGIVLASPHCIGDRHDLRASGAVLPGAPEDRALPPKHVRRRVKTKSDIPSSIPLFNRLFSRVTHHSGRAQAWESDFPRSAKISWLEVPPPIHASPAAVARQCYCDGTALPCGYRFNRAPGRARPGRNRACGREPVPAPAHIPPLGADDRSGCKRC